MGKTPPDVARISLYCTEPETTSPEYPVIGIKHLFVGYPGAFLVSIEAVSVLHAELPAAHDPEPWSDLVAEFGLDLIEVFRKLTIGLDFMADKVGDDFLMGRTEAVFPVVAISEPEKFFAIAHPSA
jgi:hypothetical protein